MRQTTVGLDEEREKEKECKNLLLSLMPSSSSPFTSQVSFEVIHAIPSTFYTIQHFYSLTIRTSFHCMCFCLHRSIETYKFTHHPFMRTDLCSHCLIFCFSSYFVCLLCVCL